MKKLISLQDIKKAISKNESVIYTDKNTLITPAAKDAASDAKIAIVNVESLDCDAIIKESEKPTVCNIRETDIALITRLVMEALSTKPMTTSQDFIKESDPSGLRLIRGNTVKCQPFQTDNSNAKVGMTEIVTIRESPNMSAGFMTIEKGSFDWKLNYEEFNVILEGKLDITINDKTYHGSTGDVFFIPKGSKITWSTPEFARFFFTTFPANWADLI